MPLKLRPTGLGSGIDKDRPDYTVYCVEWGVGRIYQTRGGPDSLRWFWSMTQRPDDASGSRGSLEEANNKAQFQKSWDGLEGVGEAGRGAIDLRCRPRRGDRERKTPPQVGPERGFQRAVRLRLGTSWTPNRASRPR